MGFRLLEICDSYSAVIDFRRQILTTKFDPRAVRVNMLILLQFLGMNMFIKIEILDQCSV